MEYRKLGRSGLKLSAVSLGSWRTYGVTVDDAAMSRIETLLANPQGEQVV